MPYYPCIIISLNPNNFMYSHRNCSESALHVYLLLVPLLSGTISHLGRDLLRSSGPPFLSKWGEPEQIALPCPFEYLCGYETPQPFWATSTNIQLAKKCFPMFSSCPVTGHHCEGTVFLSIFSTKELSFCYNTASASTLSILFSSNFLQF